MKSSLKRVLSMILCILLSIPFSAFTYSDTSSQELTDNGTNSTIELPKRPIAPDNKVYVSYNNNTADGPGSVAASTSGGTTAAAPYKAYTLALWRSLLSTGLAKNGGKIVVVGKAYFGDSFTLSDPGSPVMFTASDEDKSYISYNADGTLNITNSTDSSGGQYGMFMLAHGGKTLTLDGDVIFDNIVVLSRISKANVEAGSDTSTILVKKTLTVTDTVAFAEMSGNKGYHLCVDSGAFAFLDALGFESYCGDGTIVLGEALRGVATEDMFANFNGAVVDSTGALYFEKDDTDAPETDAPETDAPETDAPETEEPDIDIPEGPMLSDDGLWEYTLQNGSAVLTSYKGNASDVYIPAAVGTNGTEYTVTKLGDCLFENNDAINSVTLNDHVTEVGARAFYDADNFVCLVTNDVLTSIGTLAFYSCDSINSIVLRSRVVTIAQDAFGECPNLTIWCNDNSVALTYAINNGIQYELLASSDDYTVELDGVTYLISNGEATAIGCDSTLSSVSIPQTVVGYPVTALRLTFSGNSALTSVTLPEGLKVIGNSAFKDTSITEITIPGTVTKIGDFAFCGTALGSVSIPGTVTDIGKYAFYGTALRSVQIPDSVTALGSYVFGNCKQLSEIKLSGGISSIPADCFENNISLTSFVVPDNITDIGSRAFSGCNSLTALTLNRNVVSIGMDAFSGCKIEHLFVPNSVQSFGGRSLSGCYSVTLEEGITDISDAFENAIITEVTLPSTLTSLSICAFAGSHIERITIPGSVRWLEGDAFMNCEYLEEVVLEEGIVSIDRYVFANCPNIKKVFLPRSIRADSIYAFSKKTLLIVYEGSAVHEFLVDTDYIYVTVSYGNPEVSFGTEISGVVRDSRGDACGNVTVEIFNDNGTLKDKVVSDSNGAYSFTYVEVGRYIIKAADEVGRVSSSVMSVKRMNAFDVFVSGDTSLVLKTSYSVSGSVNASEADVTITDPAGNVISSEKANSGAFSFDNIPNGTYIITAESESGITAEEITVYNADLADITLIISEQSVSLSGYTYVQQRDGSNHLRNWVSVTVYSELGYAVAACKSDADGKYSFRSLPYGKYYIVAEVCDMRADRTNSYDRSYTLRGYSYVNVVDDSTYQRDIILREGSSKTADLEGKVTAKGEQQKGTVTVKNVFGDEIASYSTKNNGKFKFTNIPDGIYFITATTKSDGMGYTVVCVFDGAVHGTTDIYVYKSSKIAEREQSFYAEIPMLSSREDALAYRERISAEKAFYDSLSNKEKKQLSEDYVSKLNLYAEWISDVKYSAGEGVSVSNGGLVVSEDELASQSTVEFTVSVNKVDAYTPSGSSVKNEKDHLSHSFGDAAGHREIKQYYEISMTKTVNGEEQQITSVYKNTDTTGNFRIVLEIPEEYRGYNNYSILHEHFGEIVMLTDLDDDPNTITIEVDAFSTFVLTATNQNVTESAPDLDDDGELTNSDLAMLIRYLSGWDNELDTSIADINNDGKINNRDAIDLIVKLAEYTNA